MGPSPEFEAILISEDGLRREELGQSHLLQVDMDGPGTIFIDIASIVARAKDGSLPTHGQYWTDASDGWFDKHEQSEIVDALMSGEPIADVAEKHGLDNPELERAA